MPPSSICEHDKNMDDRNAFLPSVSVVVPIYNAADYLDQALSSIENQTLHDIEIICINDGSTDDSLDIIRDHAERDPRIVAVDKPNEGYGATCNHGIEMAHGIWVSIVEPDDWIEPGMYADMVSFANSFEEAIDIVKTPYWRVADPGTAHERKISCSYKASMKSCQNPFDIRSCAQLLEHHPSIWSAIYRRSFLDDLGIRFLPIPGAGWADNPFLVETLCQARSIAYLDRAYYCYRSDTAEESRDFYANSFITPLKRWNEMADVLERLGIEDDRIWEAQCHRGFLYIGQILGSHSMQEDDVREAVAGTLSRMRPEIVARLDSVSPSLKALYADIMGADVPTSKARYLAYLLKSGLYSIRNIGIKETLALMKR